MLRNLHCALDASAERYGRNGMRLAVRETECKRALIDVNLTIDKCYTNKQSNSDRQIPV